MALKKTIHRPELQYTARDHFGFDRRGNRGGSRRVPTSCWGIRPGSDYSRRRENRSLTMGSHRFVSALQHSLFEGIQDGHVEVREITFVPSGHGEAMNARRGGHHGVFT